MAWDSVCACLPRIFDGDEDEGVNEEGHDDDEEDENEEGDGDWHANGDRVVNLSTTEQHYHSVLIVPIY